MLRISNALVALLLIFLGCFPAHTSPLINPGPRVEIIEQLNDISLLSIQQMVQDNAGFIWMSSSTGLIRFDGYELKRFVHSPENTNSLANNYVTDLVLDQYGYIWVATQSGLSRLDPKTEQIDNFFVNGSQWQKTCSNSFSNIALGKNNALWLGSENGICQFDVQLLIQRPIALDLPDEIDITTLNISRVFVDNHDKLWFAAYFTGLFVFDAKSNVLADFATHPSKSFKLDSKTISSIFQSKDGYIWIGGRHSLHRYDSELNSFKRYRFERLDSKTNNVNIGSIAQDKEGRLWVASFSNGVGIIENGGDTIKNISEPNKSRHSFTAQSVADVLIDNSGTIWFSAFSKGLVKLNPDNMAFHHLLSDSGGDNLKIRYTDSDGDLWMTINNSLYLMDGTTRELQEIGKEFGTVYALTQHQDGRMLISSNSYGLMWLNKNSLEATPLDKINKLFHTPSGYYNITAVAIDEEEKLWLGLFGWKDKLKRGIYRYDLNSSSLTYQFNQHNLYNILPIKGGVLFTTANSGLYFVDAQSSQSDPQLISASQLKRVYDLKKDHQGNIWIGSQNNGLGLLSVDNLSIKFFNQTNGLGTNFIDNIMPMPNGDLWLTSNQGLIKYNVKDGSIKNINRKQGLYFEDFLVNSGGILANGDIVASNDSDLVIFTPSTLLNNDTPTDHKLLLSDFRLMNEPVNLHTNTANSPLRQTIHYTDKLSLTHRDILFSLKLSSNNFKTQENVRFAYRTIGFNEQWIETDTNNRVISFTSLSAGDHQLQIKTTRSDGSWSDNYRSIDITILPPWYLTRQAYIIYGIFVIALIFGFIQLRTQRVIARANKLEQTVQIRTQELKQSRDKVSTLLAQKERTFANISHEFKTPLTLILSPLESVLTATSKQLERQMWMDKFVMMKRNGNRLLRLVEQMLELSRLDNTGEQQLRHYSVKQTLKAQLNAFEPLAEHKNISLICNDFKDAIVKLQLDSLEMMMTNLLSNAIKYTQDGGEIWVLVEQQNYSVKISVQDTGIGISSEQQRVIFNRFNRASQSHYEHIPGAGIGLALVKELVESQGGTVSLKSEVSKGSRFTIELPLNCDKNIQVASEETLSRTSATEINALMSHSDIPLSKQTNVLVDNSKATILLVDDNSDMLQLLCDTLGDNYHCITAINGQNGLAEAQQIIPDVVISDIMMPKVNGYELAKSLKDSELTNHIPVILLTAKGDTQSRIQGWKQEIDDYLAKPFHPQELLLRIESLLSIRSILQQRYTQYMAANNVALSGQNRPEVIDKNTHFIEQLKVVLDQNYRDSEFNRAACADKLYMSDRQLSRKISGLLNQTFPELLGDHRLNQAKIQLTSGEPIAKICHKVGFSSQAYFAKCFKAKYGITPSQYQKSNNNAVA